LSIKKRALICGISGQDGGLLSKFLLDKNYIVFGTSRDINANNFANLVHLKIKNKVILLNMAPEDFKSVFVTIKESNPDEVYFLAGQTSVGLSFELPMETLNSITIGTLNILEASKIINKNIKIYNAGSSEIFGNTKIDNPATENSNFNPRSPYAISKAASTWLVSNYREAYGIYACTGILFNHESIYRPERFVTQKIIRTAKNISQGSKETLKLGRLDIIRDWGCAEEYVEAMWLMLQLNHPEDFLIATGFSYSLLDFVKIAFEQYNLNWSNFVVSDPSLYRPTDILSSYANPINAKKKLGWEAKTQLNSLIKKMSEN
jgi:GDPmannose 4,6-dehydratase